MTFWIRHFFLIVCCVVLPFGAALYFDTIAEVEHTRQAGAKAAEVAAGGLGAHVQLRTTSEVEDTRAVGQRIAEDRSLRDLFRAPEGAPIRARVEQILGESVPPTGFGLVLDDQGRILARAGEATGSIPAGAGFQGHPIFVRTQLGFAFDTFWSPDREVFVLSAAPLVEEGVALGAILRARPVDTSWLLTTGRALNAELSITDDSGILVTTLPEDAARELDPLVKSGAAERSSVSFGELRTPITASNAPFLPFFVDHKGKGLGYTAMSARIPHSDLTWSVAVPSGENLVELGERQAIVFAAMVASIMLAILIGLINARTFVRPLGTIEHHLSELQMGRGGIELPEVKVSGPYRRLVRLINMTVQKLPSRGVTGGFTTANLERTDLSSTDLREQSAVPAPAGPPTGDMAAGPGAPPDLFDSGFEPPPPSASPFGAPVSPPSPPPPPSDDLQGAGFTGYESTGSFSVQHTGSFQTSEAPTAMHEAPDFSGNLDTPLSQAFDSMQEPSAPPKRSAADIRGGSPTLRSEDLIAAPAQPPAPPPPAQPPTVVAPVAEDLLARSAMPDEYDEYAATQDQTAIQQLEPLAPEPEIPAEAGLDPTDRAHFREVYERFISVRRECGEPNPDIGYEKFLQKLLKNRDVLIEKYACRTVRFQVYEKDGKAALKATPVRSR